jgi:adenylate cyclase
MVETERKYLVNEDITRLASSSFSIKQGYIFSSPAKSVRVRIAKDKGFLTIKARIGESVVSRYEFEKEIDITEAEKLLGFCDDNLVEKVRHIVISENQRFEIDVFTGRNAGLVIAELELESEDQTVHKPSWLGDEVTHDRRYLNSELAVRPYCTWNAGK